MPIIYQITANSLPNNKTKRENMVSQTTSSFIMAFIAIMLAPNCSHAKLGGTLGSIERRAIKEDSPTLAPKKKMHKHLFSRGKDDIEATDAKDTSTTTTTSMTRSIGNCVDHPGWYDGDGTGYNCNWYAGESTRCSSYGDSYENFGRTANEACCACGGCIHQDGANQVADTPCGWYDADGPYYDCLWYSLVPSRCSIYGDSYQNFGKTANQACHACSGGTIL